MSNDGKSIYIAGPMRGLPLFNFPAFDRAAELLRADRWTVYNPAEADRDNGFDETGHTGNEPITELVNFDLREALASCCEFICLEADAIYMLEGWEKSLGATAERALALAIGLEVLYE